MKKVDLVKNFATSSISGQELYDATRCTEFGGEVRNLLRPGIMRARQISRKALKRRGY